MGKCGIENCNSIIGRTMVNNHNCYNGCGIENCIHRRILCFFKCYYLYTFKIEGKYYVSIIILLNMNINRCIFTIYDIVS